MFHSKKLEELTQLIEKLKKNSKDAALIVEGESDQKALETLGVKADFFLICRITSSLRLKTEEIGQKYKRAILMLDQDKKGRELTKKLTTYLQKEGVKVDTKLSKLILTKANTSTVEGLAKRVLHLV